MNAIDKIPTLEICIVCIKISNQILSERLLCQRIMNSSSHNTYKAQKIKQVQDVLAQKRADRHFS